MAASAQTTQPGLIPNADKQFPHVGKPRVVVILAEYRNLKFTLPNPRKSIEQYLNHEGYDLEDFGHSENENYASARQYFKDMSYGQFEPQFDVYGPVTLPNDSAYYGGNQWNGADDKPDDLVADACTAMNDSLDFTQYDADGDGRIDLVYVIYPGYSENQGGENGTMVTKSFYMGPRGILFPGSQRDLDGKRLGWAGISSELLGTRYYPKVQINGVGFFVHEFSHCLGLPDVYTTNGSKESGLATDNRSMEYWDLMDAGTYTKKSFQPTAYTSWERWMMGWEELPVASEPGEYTLTSAQSKRAVRIVNPANENDYFVLELIEPEGWNSYLGYYKATNSDVLVEPKAGLLIYHIDYDSRYFAVLDYTTKRDKYSNRVNYDVNHPRMVAVAADSMLIGNGKEPFMNSDNDGAYARSLVGDLFREGDTFTTGGGRPHDAWWTATDNVTTVNNIRYENGKLSFSLAVTTGIDGITTNGITTTRPTDNRIYTLDGRYVGTSTSNLAPGVYIRNGKKFVR